METLLNLQQETGLSVSSMITFAVPSKYCI